MAIDINKVIGWFDAKKGYIMYSMTGSRNGSDNTADCSGSITQAIYEAGGKAYAYLYSTVTLPAYLQVNGFQRISVNEDWESKRGDVILESWGNDMSSSGGSGGHVGVMKSDTVFISCDYWTGGQYGTAISEHSWNDYYSYNPAPYIEVWRYVGGEAVTIPSVPVQPNNSNIDQILNKGEYFKARVAYRVDEFEYVHGVEQVINYELAGGKDFNWYWNGIGIASIDKVDKNGNITADQKIDVGDYFRFHSDRIKVEDASDNGVALGTRYGLVWVSAETLIEVE